MAELKTKVNDGSVDDFLNGIQDEEKRKDSIAIIGLMQEVTGEEPRMWGGSIVGFGSYHYKYASGQEGDWMLVGFSPRKQNLTIYIMSGFDSYSDDLKKLGRVKTGKSCLYINKIEDVDIQVLKGIIRKSVEFLSKK